jgi:galactokinase
VPCHPIVAFGPGRVNVIGEHTDYNGGLALPFAIEQGVRVMTTPLDSEEVIARALDHSEDARFPLTGGGDRPLGGWRSFVQGAIAELCRAGVEICGAELEISGDVPQGGGLSSSAALEVSLCLALLAAARTGSGAAELADRIALAKLCSRIENDWVGARSGLLDQLASLLGEPGHAVRIDFRSLEVRPVPLPLGAWQLITIPSGEQHSLAASGYNERVAECERARQLLGIDSLRDAQIEDLGQLPDPLDRRVRHVIEENGRVDETIAAFARGDLAGVGGLLNRSHASLRDLYDSSTDAVERTVAGLYADGAVGARMMGGGFGGHVLALFGPDATLPADAVQVSPSAGARLLEGGQ